MLNNHAFHALHSNTFCIKIKLFFNFMHSVSVFMYIMRCFMHKSSFFIQVFAKYTFSPKQFLGKQRLNTEVKKHNDSQYDSVVTKHFKIMFSDILHEELDRKDGNRKRNDRSQQKQKYLHTREI